MISWDKRINGQMKGARKTKRGLSLGGAKVQVTFAANCQHRAECSRELCPLAPLVLGRGEAEEVG